MKRPPIVLVVRRDTGTPAVERNRHERRRGQHSIGSVSFVDTSQQDR